MKAAAAAKAKTEQEAAQRKQAEQQQQAAAALQAKKDADAAAATQAIVKTPPAMKLSQYFDAIAGASTVSSANSSIADALSLFESPDSPVLVIISNEGGQKDYDKPTTIKVYLNYLKDQKKNTNKIDNIQYNSAGKISELELKK